MNLRRHGLSIENYEHRLKEQNFVCAVCHKPEEDSNQYSLMSLSVDHNHETGEIRGLLCHRCNRALGLLDDDSENIESLLNYRRKYN